MTSPPTPQVSQATQIQHMQQLTHQLILEAPLTRLPLPGMDLGIPRLLQAACQVLMTLPVRPALNRASQATLRPHTQVVDLCRQRVQDIAALTASVMTLILLTHRK